MRFFKLTSLLLVFIFSCFLSCGGSVYEFYQNRNRKSAALTLKNVVVGDHTVVYLEGGKGKTIVLVHGFGSEKDHWVHVAAGLTSSYHVIIPDLPGFGESTKLSSASYDMVSQADRLHAFIKQVIPSRPVAVAGHSMGGNIAGHFAAKYPQEVSHLILIDSSGITSPEKSDLVRALEQGVNPLLVSSESDFSRLLSFCYVEPPYIPSSTKRFLAERAIRNKPGNEKVWSDMLIKKPSNLDDKLSLLTMPVLIIWGDSDRLIHISAVSVLEKGIKNHTTRIIKKCGHQPILEKPEETANDIKEFLEK